QRLLASDPRHATTLGWEALEPAPRLTSDPARPDPRIAAGEAREKQARAFTPQIFAIHPSHAHEAEEEIMFLADAFLSHVPEASCDVPAYRAWLDEQDFTPAYRHLRRTLQLLQWQKKRRGEPCQRWVLKTPAHLGYLDLLFETFPGAHVIHMHRDPLETIPSGASLNTALWRLHADRVDPAKVGRQWIERMAWTNRRALSVRAGLPDERRRFTDIRFRTTISDPLGQVQRVYEAGGVDLDDAARSAMHAWIARDAQEKLPQHRYAAGDFGLSEDGIRAAFAEYTDRFLSS
ncbi:MAG TPA: sulfotransferase, partial [Myxococcota bacterium]|nr:sulfotransferase [Myxococcota bacterium]